jgi:hypothetical protein
LAKLNGVKTTPETIEYAGFTYQQTPEDAKTGDIIRIIDTEDNVTEGGYYVVDSVDFAGDAQITDDDGDSYDTSGDKFTVFRKTAAVSDDTVEFNGKTYAKVERPVKAGDVIRWGDKYPLIDVNAGSLYEVKAQKIHGELYFTDDAGDKRFAPLGVTERYEVYAETTPTTAPEYVIHDGKVYAKSAPGTVAKTGDTVVTIASEGHGWPSGVIAVRVSEFTFRSTTKTTIGRYEGNYTQFLKPHEYTVLTPVATEKRKPKIGERVIVVDAEGNAGRYANGDVVTVERVDSHGDPIINGSITYYSEYLVLTDVTVDAPPATEVKRKAEAGARIKIVDRWSLHDPYENGAILTVTRRSSPDHVQAAFNDETVTVHDREYVVLAEKAAEVPQPHRYAVGDFVEVIANPNAHNYEIGSVVEIVDISARVLGPEQAFHAKKPDGSVGNWLVTDAVKPAQKPQPKRLTIGDYAKVVKLSAHNYALGTLIKIAVDDKSVIPYKGERPDGTVGNWLRAEYVEAATEAEFNAAKPEPVDPRDAFVVGDKVRLLSGGGEFPLHGYEDGAVYTVENPKYNGHKRGPVVTITGGSVSQGFAKADQLEKVTEEAAKPARLKVGEYAKTLVEKDVPAGAIVKIVQDDRDATPYKCVVAGVDSPDDEEWDWYRADELEAVPARLKVGELATVVNTDDDDEFPVGVAVRVLADDGTRCPYLAETLGGEYKTWFHASDLEKFTGDAAAAEETAKWAKIGRKVNEFKAGDIVEIKNPCCAPLKSGDYAEVHRDSNDIRSVAVTERGWLVSVVKLVTPVEQRFDTPKAA